MHRTVDTDAVPAGRTVVQLSLPDVPAETREWWL